MSILKNLTKATVAIGALNAASKLIQKDFSLDTLQNSAQNAAKDLASDVEKLKGGLNFDTSQLLNAIPGQANELINDIANTIINVAKQATEISSTEAGEVPFNSSSLPMPNELMKYASVNYNWTLSVLSPFHVNFPDSTYKKGDLGTVILKSASADPEDRVSLPNYASSRFGHKMDFNAEGKFDFFMDNIRINGVMGLDEMTKNTNSTTMSFSVFEPYSIGLFFQSLQMAAGQNGYENWVVAPVLLTLQFKGHYGPDEHFKEDTVAIRHFPIKITNIDLKVTDRGSQYECSAVAWNDEAYSEEVSTVKTDINLIGKTVQEMLQKGKHSLQRTVNDLLAEQAKKNKIPIPDRIIILFPTDTSSAKAGGSSDDSSSPAGATTGSGEPGGAVFKKLGLEMNDDNSNYIQKDGVNPIGKASMGFTDRRKVEAIFGEDNVVWDPSGQVFTRGKLKINATEGQAHFKQGTQISQIINEVVSSSYYGITALEPENTKGGKVEWYKINAQYFLIDTQANMPITGRMPVVTVFRIIPYRVNKAFFMPSDGKPKPEPPVKEYDYIYTGQNTEILDFQIRFATTFYTATVSDAGKNQEDVRQRDKNATIGTPQKPETGGTAGGGGGGGGDGSTKLLTRPSSLESKRNGGGVMPFDLGTFVVQQFQNAINQSADMINVTLKILGDPFYLGDSGIGNYSAAGTSNDDVTADNTIHYERSMVFIKINFKNPIDINGNLYDFPGAKAVPLISGIYKVNTLESTFERGLFSQVLEICRMPNLDADASGGADNAPTFDPKQSNESVDVYDF